MNAPARILPLAARTGKPLAKSLEKGRLRSYLALVITDCLILVTAFTLAAYLFNSGAHFAPLSSEVQILLPIFLTLGLYQNVYSIRALSDLKFAFSRLLSALFTSAVLLTFLQFYIREDLNFSRGVLSVGLVLSFVLMQATRAVVAQLQLRNFGPSMQNILLVDAGGPPVSMEHAFHIQAEEHNLTVSRNDPNVLDRFGRYALNMDRVIVSCPIADREEWAFVLRAAGVNGEVVSEQLHDLGAVALMRETNFTSLVISTGPLGLRSRVGKRVLDLSVTIAALMALIPLFLIIALLIKLEDGGPVFFVQRRLGRGNRFFEMLKFRSMRAERSDATGSQSASKDDDRITKIGSILRRTSLDELPQLINVLKGDMSLVGPRPHAVGSLAGNKLFWEVDSRYWRRHSLKPGLTGLAQVRGYRGATDQERDLTDRLQSDLEYVRSWSIWKDITIIFRTATVLIHHRAF
ncbi:exopolysaccharide biosynthesis polyprenyl glycosylphosphotransferase [Altericroceibacterium endophyticum]|uniref:Exopolysaccharide biosynthesis polyprenyl glycosylphosphotransferase n=1 Tax=Altericroceibacterium endophyticum TaxID=1808508 RepID=A0A6I4TA42_9SPHN|nr:exopolysaccharide biosynthesis polyprenyl glycosylphosphotransferase [Altericroceibacterium endophyticum]MXO67031.1 exopolysaccharide biosynthesis polyprenyl glycosylphosphotransferase [Altericroceibacterium endophyticum]